MATSRLIALQATLKILAAPLLWILVTMSSGGALIWQGWQHQRLAEESHAATLQSLTANRKRQKLLLQQQQDAADFSAPYLALTGQNRFAPDRKFDWRDALENLRERKLVSRLDYRIFPQARFDGANISGQSPGYSEMKLNFGLLHEEQLLDFLDALDTEDSGWFRLESCTLQRDATNDAEIILHAECNGRWITLGREGSP
ncbi:MAG: hypothetical protein PHW66_02550 [Gallionella sp.]|jgi:hypothetical protein|nr:hypothetical protein [Gallionella sp.]